MSKILVLGRTMDMGGTEVAMAALLQKLVEKKEDVTLLLVEKRGVLLERIPKEVEVRQMIWDKKPHPALERIVGKRETPAERSFYARGMGVFLMRVVYGKKRYGKLYERILECVAGNKTIRSCFRLFRIRCVHNRIRSQKDECAEKSGLVPRRKSLVAVPDQGLYSGV